MDGRATRGPWSWSTGAWVAALVFVTAALAGCLGGLSEDAGAAGDGAATGADGPRFGPESGLALDPAAGEARTLDAPPTWAVGEWWRIRVDYPPYGHSAEITRVVAGVEGETAPADEPDWQAGAYLVGLAKDSWDDGALVLHFPGVGHVDPVTLGFEAHDLLIEPLTFPLEEGRTWTTQWYSGDALEAEVVEVDEAEGTARIEMTGVRTIHLTYDAELGAISKLDISDYGGYEVVDHGFGFDGVVRVPYAHDLTFCHGRAALVLPITLCELETTPAAGPPEGTIDLGEEYDAASFGLFMADLERSGPLGKGVYAVHVETPDGERYEATMLPTDGPMVLETYGQEPAAGTWTWEAYAPGPGLAILEGVAYRVFDVELPGGATAAGE